VQKPEAVQSEIFDDIPRGVTSRFLTEQSAPQNRWITAPEIIAQEDIHYDPADPGGKILLGSVGDQLIGINDNRHMLTMAGSRAGKSVTAIANLFFYPGSVLCTDPKGELASLTAKKRAALGQKVYILDPFDIVDNDAREFQASYNPLKRLNIKLPTLIEDALSITDAMIVSSGEEKDPHWNESASHFIMGLILYVVCAPSLTEEERNLATVRTLINKALETEDVEDKKLLRLPRLIFKAVQKLRVDGHEEICDVMEAAIISFYDKGEEERGSVLSTARRHTQFLEFFSIKNVVRDHDFDLADLKRDPKGISVYLVLPATKMNLCNRWLRLFINQLLSAMESEREIPKVPVLVCLDEFPVLGFMQQLQDAAGQIASFGVRLWIILQDWGQGKSLYGERFESFIANAGVFQAFGNVDTQTTEYLSNRLGHTLIEDPASAKPDSSEPVLSPLEHNRQQYPLLTPDEISRTFSRNDPLKRQLILWSGYHPIILQRVEYFDEDDLLRPYLAV